MLGKIFSFIYLFKIGISPALCERYKSENEAWKDFFQFAPHTEKFIDSQIQKYATTGNDELISCKKCYIGWRKCYVGWGQ